MFKKMINTYLQKYSCFCYYYFYHFQLHTVSWTTKNSVIFY